MVDESFRLSDSIGGGKEILRIKCQKSAEKAIIDYVKHWLASTFSDSQDIRISAAVEAFEWERRRLSNLPLAGASLYGTRRPSYINVSSGRTLGRGKTKVRFEASVEKNSNQPATRQR